jgi:hypothetical protein
MPYVRRENILPTIKEHGLQMADKDIPHEYYGWWRIIEMVLGSDHDNLLLIQHKASVWIPFMVLRAPFWGPKTTL